MEFQTFFLLFVFVGSMATARQSIDSKTDVRSMIQSKSQELAKCQKEHPKVKGQLVLDWEILEDGSVGKVIIEKSVSPALDRCVTSKLKTWTFTPPAGKTTIRIKFPFRFQGRRAN